VGALERGEQLRSQVYMYGGLGARLCSKPELPLRLSSASQKDNVLTSSSIPFLSSGTSVSTSSLSSHPRSRPVDESA
jgi:hypothetical protein